MKVGSFLSTAYQEIILTYQVKYEP